jgi:hypothetical protein
MNFGVVRDHGHTCKCYLNPFLFDAVFKYGDGAKFRGYVGINAEPLCAEFFNFVQCHVFVYYLTFAVNELLITVRKVGRLVLSRTSCFVFATFFLWSCKMKFPPEFELNHFPVIPDAFWT